MSYYNQKAKELFDKYQSVDSDKVHASWSGRLPPDPDLALDVGGGSGRDAKWLADKGWEVVVVEPAKGLFELGREFTKGHRITWIDDCLPYLEKLKGYRSRFSLILVSGVFMHLSYDERLESFQTLERLMAKDAILVISLRHGPDLEKREFYQVVPEEIVGFANKNDFQSEIYRNQADKLGRKEVTWETIIVTKRGEG